VSGISQQHRSQDVSGISQQPSIMSQGQDNKSQFSQSSRYIKNLHPVLGKDKEKDMPQDALCDFEKRSNDLNDGHLGMGILTKSCWLVPEYTSDSSQAATGFHVLVQDKKDERYVDIGQGTGGSYRYVIPLHEPNKPKCTDVKLFRTSDKALTPVAQGFTGFSRDINEGRGGDYLYLAWHSK
jgi:hypothetical protein